MNIKNNKIFFKDQRDKIQKKTFTKWVNKHLSKCASRIGDLFDDLRDGKHLILLLEQLSGRKLVNHSKQVRKHKLILINKNLFLNTQ